MIYYAKICYQGEGVVEEISFTTKQQAEAFCLGFDKSKDVFDDEEIFEDYFCCVDTKKAKEE